MDLFPTLASIASAKLPADHQLDGYNILPMLKGEKETIRELVYFYNQSNLYAIRKGAWKAHFTTKPSYSQEPALPHDPPLLYNLEKDPSEKYDVSKDHPEIIAMLKMEFEKHKAEVRGVPSHLEARL
jgi:arylsulfatase